jgi:hypothetical protein
VNCSEVNGVLSKSWEKWLQASLCLRACLPVCLSLCLCVQPSAWNSLARIVSIYIGLEKYFVLATGMRQSSPWEIILQRVTSVLWQIFQSAIT